MLPPMTPLARAAWLLAALLAACGGPVAAPVTVFDAGFAADDGSVSDAGGLDGGAPSEAGVDAGARDVGGADADPRDVTPGDADPEVDGGDRDGGPDDAAPRDVGATDLGVDAGAPDAALDAGQLDSGEPDAGPDAGRPDGGPVDVGVDAGPQVLIEDFGVGTFTCPDGTVVRTATTAERGAACIGISGSACPEQAMLPGPGAPECSDPRFNPFTGPGQCVTDFFACFGAAGACTTDGMGRFTWASGAVQMIRVDPMSNALIEARFTPSGGATPCIVAVPDPGGGPRVRYERR